MSLQHPRASRGRLPGAGDRSRTDERMASCCTADGAGGRSRSAAAASGRRELLPGLCRRLGGTERRTPTAAGTAPAPGAAEALHVAGEAGLPPEMKAENKFKAPVATGNFVWTANPTSGRVAYINASDVQRPDHAGRQRPTYLAAVPDMAHPADDVAVVLNVLSEDATLLRVDPQAGLTTQTYASTVDANSWAISLERALGNRLDGRHVRERPGPDAGISEHRRHGPVGDGGESPAARSVDAARRRIPARGVRLHERRLAGVRRDRGRDLGHRSAGRKPDGHPTGPPRGGGEPAAADASPSSRRERRGQRHDAGRSTRGSGDAQVSSATRVIVGNAQDDAGNAAAAGTTAPRRPPAERRTSRSPPTERTRSCAATGWRTSPSTRWQTAR